MLNFTVVIFQPFRFVNKDHYKRVNICYYLDCWMNNNVLPDTRRSSCTFGKVSKVF